MRALQKTGKQFAILPVAISYERLPEEHTLLEELRGQPKPRMQLSALLKWTGKLVRGEIKLGQIHVKCGAPCLMTPQTDVPTLAEKIMGELQLNTVATDYHLKAFLKRSEHLGMNFKTLKRAIQARGGEVLSSRLEPDETLSWEQELCLRYQWQHWFYEDLRKEFPANPAVRHHLRENGYLWGEAANELEDFEARPALLRALVAPVVESYRVTAQMVADGKESLAPTEVVRLKHQAHLPFVENAFQFLLEEGLLELDESGRFALSKNSERAMHWRDAFALREKTLWMMPGGEA